MESPEEIRSAQVCHDPKDEQIRTLEAEVAALQSQLKSLTQNVQTQFPQADLVSPSSVPGPQYQTSGRRNAGENRLAEKYSPGPVFRHLGRLVCAEDGVDQFAGSSTGVHFTLSAQTKYQILFSSNETFPEPVFSLHLLGRFRKPGENTELRRQTSTLNLQSIFSQPQSYYLSEVEKFLERWSPFYPIIARKQFFDAIGRIFNVISSNQELLGPNDEIALHQLLIVLAIMAPETTDKHIDGSKKSSEFYYTCSLDLYHSVASIGNLGSLQGMLLLLLYYQQIGQHHLVYQTVGSIVRLANSLGLHRHARRFRFCVGETEIRKRLWWCVYILDVTTSLHYGLPKIINNEDDDNDLPADCDFDDMTLDKLPLPLPGESTRMSPFLCYIRLAKILSSILKELYTTTHRRNGIQKIEKLTRELQVWESLSEPTIGRFIDVEQDYDQLENAASRDVMAVWLHLLGQIALIYVHRPALTFEPTEPQFIASLPICVKASTNVISLLSQFRGEERFFRLFPAGPNIIFQCAILCLFQTWHHISSNTPASPLSFIHNSERIELSPKVETAAGLLDDLEQSVFLHSSSTQSGYSSKPPHLSQASWVLRHLSTITMQSIMTNTPETPRPAVSSEMSSYSFSGSNEPQTQRLDPMQFSPDSIRPELREQSLHDMSGSGIPAEFLFGHGNGLGYLNQMDESTWTFLSQMGGYSGEPNSDFMGYG